MMLHRKADRRDWIGMDFRRFCTQAILVPAMVIRHARARNCGRAVAASKLSRVEEVKRFLIIGTPWEPGGEELTRTMKLRRRPIAEKYSAEIDKLYAQTPGPDIVALPHTG